MDRKDRKGTRGSTATLTDPYRPGSVGGSGSNPNSGLTDASPAMTEMMGDFSWTDLDAIGNFAVNGNGGANIGDNEWWSGFLPADPTNFMFESIPALDDWSLGLQ